jgi:hypothetical protein
MNFSKISHLSKQQQLVHTIMFLDPDKIPNFPPSSEAFTLGLKIKDLFDKGVLSHLSLDNEGNVVCY